MKKKVIIGTFIAVGIFILIFTSILGIRYIKYNDVIGEYELIEGENVDSLLNPLRLNLYSWNQGNKEDLKCDLWNCSYYEEGYIYYLKGDMIIFKYDGTGSMRYKYDFKRENNETYLILKGKYAVKYKKKY